MLVGARLLSVTNEYPYDTTAAATASQHVLGTFTRRQSRAQYELLRLRLKNQLILTTTTLVSVARCQQNIKR